MIAFLEGMVRLIRKESIVLDVHQVGYEVFVANPQEFPRDQFIFLYTYQQFREDSQALYGFRKESELSLFKMLINVKGVGVKTALKALGVMPSGELLQAINEGDLKKLKTIPGIGARSAGQIVLDLKGKVVNEPEEEDSLWTQAKEALMALGYRKQELAGLEKELDSSQYALDELIRKSLQLLAVRKGM